MLRETKITKTTFFVIILSLVNLGFALVSRASQTSITFLQKDIEWLLFLSFAMLIPLYRNQIFNEAFLKEDIEKIQSGLKGDIEKIQSDLTDIKRISSAGVVKFIGKANEAALHVVDKIQSASEIYNTYIIYDNPYTPKTSKSIEEALKKYLREEKGLWEETVSRLGSQRVVDIEKEIGKLPPYFKVRVLREDKGVFPVCNFIVLRFPIATDRNDEIFFGWGYFKGGANESVFWSDDQNIVNFFLGYHRALREDDISEPHSQ
jgi:hypothetical protein